MKERAYAKINLSIDVIGKLENGYHDLDMVMVPIDFYDVVDIEISDEMSFSSNIKFLKMDSKNTIIKVIEIMRENFNFKENFKIELTKHIPTQAGLAGGSSDAAATIKILNKILNLNINESELMNIAAKIGADVPFCLNNKPSIVKGIGEKIENIEIDLDFYIFLAKPKKGVSTKIAFENLDFSNLYHPNISKVKKDLEDGDYESLCNDIGNSLESSAFKIVKSIEVLKTEMKDFGFDGVLMSGSGSTVFGITRNLELMDKAANEFRNKGYFVRKTKILK